ncbi:MAG TPA: hypothetical protein VE595_01595 [Nitrososphaeraceae archaeon]|nr:hypothetical protein [Nitrososphaeraceae archaeon]
MVVPNLRYRTFPSLVTKKILFGGIISKFSESLKNSGNETLTIELNSR